MIKELKTREKLNLVVCVTGKHREMLDQVLIDFDVTLVYDLYIMRAKQTLFDVTINILEKMKAVLDAVKPDIVLVYGDTDRIRVIEPLEVLDIHNFLSRSHLILTNSGGLQEEASSLGKPVLFMIDITERPEGIAAGTLKLIGTDEGLSIARSSN